MSAAPRSSTEDVVAARGRRAVFIDKDGTLVHDVPYNVDPARLTFTPSAIEALKLLRAFGYALVVVSNQPGIALGRFDAAALGRLVAALGDRLAAHGLALDGFYACPHASAREGSGCACRKPRPGLLLQAAAALDLDLARSWMVGDILDDIEAGRRADCRTVLLDVDHETEWLPGPLREPHHRARDLFDAAQQIVAHDLQDAGIAPVDSGLIDPPPGVRRGAPRTAEAVGS
jgi:histidinol-phosphate phosphatase family protein